MEEKLNLTAEWDKVFPKSNKVSHKKVTFHNRYGITLAADLYAPKDAQGRLPAIAVCGPFGAVKDYYDYYKTKRGYHPRSLNSNGGWNVTGCQSFLNQPILQYSQEIRSAVLVVHGEKAHSCYFSRDAFAKLTGENKELMIIPGAVHTDLYDRMDVIPFDKLVSFFSTWLH